MRGETAGRAGGARRFWERTILLHGELVQTACIGACECTAFAYANTHIPVQWPFVSTCCSVRAWWERQRSRVIDHIHRTINSTIIL